jgi:amidase
VDPVDIAYAGVVGQRELLRSGELTAVQLLQICLDRIDRYDGRIGAFRTLFRDTAAAEAAAADAALAAGDDRPLLGVPIAIKDNVPVAGHAALLGTSSPEPDCSIAVIRRPPRSARGPRRTRRRAGRSGPG